MHFLLRYDRVNTNFQNRGLLSLWVPGHRQHLLVQKGSQGRAVGHIRRFGVEASFQEVMSQVITPVRINRQRIVYINMIPFNRIGGGNAGDVPRFSVRMRAFCRAPSLKASMWSRCRSPMAAWRLDMRLTLRVRVLKFFQQIIPHGRIHQGLPHQLLQPQGGIGCHTEDQRSGQQPHYPD